MSRILTVGLGLILLGGVNAQEKTPESKIRGQWVGTWKLILGDKFVGASGSSSTKGSEWRWILGYDAQQKAYRYWFFDSEGDTVEAIGTWDEKTSTMTWKAEAGPGLIGTATHRFLNADSYEWTYVVKNK